ERKFLCARPDQNAVRLRVEGTFPGGWTKLREKLEYLSVLAEGHRIVVNDTLDGERHERVADRATRVLVFEREKPQGFGSFVLLGVEHIFTGYDHLLFLLALLLAGGTLRQLLLVVTSFTVAHSITLALAALEVVTLPSKWVESAIALSIVVVAIEDFLVGGVRRDGTAGQAPRWRWLLAFGFGLIHGFGFASILAEMHLARHGVLKALLGFNLGVEAGQAVLVVVTAPLIALARRSQAFLRYGVPGLSLLILGAGTYWLVQRAFLE
ncbi:MAG: HupE/UreJ family protein, partial [Myxococcales bacterium]